MSRENLYQDSSFGGLMPVIGLLLLAAACSPPEAARQTDTTVDDAAMSDESQGENWLAFGRTYSEQRYSPLEQINDSNVTDLGVVFPEHLSGFCIDSANAIHAANKVENPVHDQRGRDQSVIVWQIEIPVDGQISDIGVIDLLEWAESLLAVCTTERKPVLSL